MTRLEHLQVLRDSSDELVVVLGNLFESLQNLQIVDVGNSGKPGFYRYYRDKLQNPLFREESLHDKEWVL
jgi:hypothetical protein